MTLTRSSAIRVPGDSDPVHTRVQDLRSPDSDARAQADVGSGLPTDLLANTPPKGRRDSTLESEQSISGSPSGVDRPGGGLLGSWRR